MNSESSSWGGELSAYLFPRGKCHSLSPDPTHCLGPGSKAPGSRAATRQERQLSAGRRRKDTAAPEAHPQSTPLSHTTGNRHRLPLVSREQEQVKKEAANYSGNGP